MAVAARKTRDVIDVVQGLRSDFAETIGRNWKSVRRQSGNFLLDARRNLNRVQFAMLQNFVQQDHRITRAEQDVCMRLAAGDIPDEGWLELTTPAKLRLIPTEKLLPLDHFVHIYSPEAGGPIRKRLSELTIAERRACITSQGVIEIDTAVRPEENKGLKTVRASLHKIEGNCIVFYVPSQRMQVRYAINDQLLKDLSAS